MKSDRLYHYMRNVGMKWLSRFRIPIRQSYDSFYLYYSSGDRNLFYQLYGAQISSELICRRVDNQKTAIRIHFGYCDPRSYSS